MTPEEPDNPRIVTVGDWPGGRIKPGVFAIALHPPLTALDLGRACRQLRQPTDERPHLLTVHPATQVQAEKAARRVVRDLNIALALHLTTDHAPGEWAISDGRSTLWSAGGPRILAS